MQKLFKGGLHILIGLRTRLNCLHVHLTVLVAQLLCIFRADLSHAGIILHHVKFVADQHDTDVWRGLTHQRFEPKFNICEAFLVCDVVHDQTAEGFAIVSNCNCAVLFLPCRVPKLGFHGGAVLHNHIFCGKFDANCWLDTLR